MKDPRAISMKLLAVSRKIGMNHQALLIRYFHERLLERLSRSAHREKLRLKGGSLIYSWQGEKARPTVDIDFSGSDIKNDEQEVTKIFKEIIQVKCDDGVEFHEKSLSVSVISEQNQYNGIRLKVKGSLGNIEQNIQVDVGFGDVITPAALELRYPVILEEFESPVVFAYTAETVIAEKLQAIIALAQLNSRMKDFYDVYTLLQSQTINADVLRAAIDQTFKTRNTPVVFNSPVFEERFYTDKSRNVMWTAFLKKINARGITFQEVVQFIKSKIDELYG